MLQVTWLRVAHLACLCNWPCSTACSSSDNSILFPSEKNASFISFLPSQKKHCFWGGCFPYWLWVGQEHYSKGDWGLIFSKERESTSLTSLYGAISNCMQESPILMPALPTYHGWESSFCLSGSPPLSSLPLVGHDFWSNHCSLHLVELSLHCSTFSEIA